MLKNSILYIIFIISCSLANTKISQQEIIQYLSDKFGQQITSDKHKCGTFYDLLINSHWHELDDSFKNSYRLTKIMPDTMRQFSMKSPSGHFILHWDTTGTNSVPKADIGQNGIPDYIDSAMVILDHVWRVEIDQLGYSAPPDSNGQPVRNYHVYFTNMPYYGLTTGSGNDIPALPHPPYVGLVASLTPCGEFVVSVF